jgi:hypothetical protein
VVATYVNKKRRQEKNILDQAGAIKPVEVGAVWSTPAPPGGKRSGAARMPWQDSILHAGHFLVDPKIAPAAAAEPEALASGRLPLPAWLVALPLRFKEGHP